MFNKGHTQMLILAAALILLTTIGAITSSNLSKEKECKQAPKTCQSCEVSK
jgi:hypothetical protein